MDISNLTLSQLEVLYAQIPTEIEKRKREEREKILSEVTALAAKHGFDLGELVRSHTDPKKLHKAVRKPATLKFRSPVDNRLTWSGRGRKPRWVSDWINQGRTLEELKV